MTVSEKVTYLKGLAEGMKLNEEKDADKLTLKILDVLSDIALDMEDMDDALAELSAQVDEIDEDLSMVEEIVYDDEDGCGCGCDCDCDCDCDCGCGCGDDDEEFYEVTCPACNADLKWTRRPCSKARSCARTAVKTSNSTSKSATAKTVATAATNKIDQKRPPNRVVFSLYVYFDVLPKPPLRLAVASSSSVTPNGRKMPCANPSPALSERVLPALPSFVILMKICPSLSEP